MRQPQHVEVAKPARPTAQIEQRFYEIYPEQRMDAVTKRAAALPAGVLRGVLLHQAAGARKPSIT